MDRPNLNQNTAIPMHEVKSSQIGFIGYQDSTMYVKFKNGKVYSYFPVGFDKFEEFKNSESIGSFFHKNFKSNSELTIKPIKL